MQNVQRSGGAGPAGRGDSSRRLMKEGVFPGIKYPVQYRQNTATGMGVIDGRAEDETIRFPGFFDNVVYNVVIKYAASGQPAAGAAGGAVPYRVIAKK